MVLRDLRKGIRNSNGNSVTAKIPILGVSTGQAQPCKYGNKEMTND